MLLHAVLILVLCLVAALPARADELGNAVLSLCDKVKACAEAEIGAKNLTPETRQQMQPVLDNMCAVMQSKFTEIVPGHPLHASAVACLRSMEALTCEKMRDPVQIVTPACEAYEKSLEESKTGS